MLVNLIDKHNYYLFYIFLIIIDKLTNKKVMNF
jgi:hypothetical protein